MKNKGSIKVERDREKEIYEFIHSYFPNETRKKGRWSEIYSVMKFLYNEHPKIKSVEKTESPDFVISFKSGEKIGIEHTMIKKDNIESKKIESTNALIEKAERLFEKKYPEVKLLVNISFLDNYVSFQKIETDVLAAEISDFVYNYYTNRQCNRPDYIKNIRISPHSCVSFYNQTCWYVENLNREIFQKKLDKKEIKLQNYKKYNSGINYYWLVMVISSTPTSYDIEYFNLEGQIQSDFDKIFLYHTFYNKVICVK